MRGGRPGRSLPGTHAALAEAWGYRGSRHGLSAIAEGIAGGADRGGQWAAEFHRLQGELLALAGSDVDRVEAASSAPWRLMRQQAGSLELRGRGQPGPAVAAPGRFSQGRQLLQPLYAWFIEGFDTRTWWRLARCSKSCRDRDRGWRVPNAAVGRKSTERSWRGRRS